MKKPPPLAQPPALAMKKSTVAESASARKKPAAGAVPAVKKRASGGNAGRRPRKRARDGSCGADLINSLPDDILGTIVSLLPTKDAARTQAIARRWRPLWRSTPLNIDADDISTANSRYSSRRRGPRPPVSSIISRILSDHPGPVRRFDFRAMSRTAKRGNEKDAAQIESWLHSPSLDNLQELHIIFPFLILPSNFGTHYQLPSSVLLRFASTIVVATIGRCDFPNELAPSLSFPFLKHLTLCRVYISQDVFHGLFSACNVLETLILQESVYRASLHISSPTLRSIGFSKFYMDNKELVIEDTPHLEKMLCIDLCVETIRVNRAPKLEILGPLSPGSSNIQIEKLVLQGLIPTSLSHSICSVNVLALAFSCTELDAVLDILRFFPCLEKLYVTWNRSLMVQMKNVRRYDPLDPIKCLQTRLKKLVMKNYKGDEQDVSFAKFFVLNAEVVKEIKFGVNKKINKEWVADQHRLLGVENKASPDAHFKFILVSYFNVQFDTHDLSIADPFNKLFSYADGPLIILGLHDVICLSSSHAGN
ncbi:unnamed protein product [Alopecurus aequalis]